MSIKQVELTEQTVYFPALAMQDYSRINPPLGSFGEMAVFYPHDPSLGAF